MSRKEKMKVYHGIPKSPTDEHTIFYADLDGNTTPEIGSPCIESFNVQNINFINTLTGYGLRYPNYKETDKWYFKYPIETLKSAFTYDLVGDLTDTNTNNKCLLFFTDLGNTESYVFFVNTSTKQWQFYDSSTTTTYKVASDTTPTTGIHHIRITYSNSTISFYCDGKLMGTISIILTNFNKLNHLVVGNVFQGSTTFLRSYSDLHLSNIDRGDYFPNLPQDFIEGKAIIKERLGQQQIKGDPLISQTTELIVKSYDDYGKAPDSNGYWTCVRNPELSLTGSVWISNSTVIVIKGLNNEIISGVIDSDTNICKVIKIVEGGIKGVSYAIVEVDNTTGLTVGDIVQIKYNNGIYSGIPTTTIESITGNVVKLKFSGNLSQGIDSTLMDGYLCEITSTTSSPIVKTVDGTVINGTWTGLGTNSASFRVGEITPGLERKDLVITYSLNIAPGNSHFPELPSDIERAYTETGIEMKPVSEIVIEDDFKGKISGSLKECPHIMKYVASQNIYKPSEYVSEGTTEYYNWINSNDSTTFKVNSSVATYIPQNLFSFNLVEMIEKKIGEIPSVDKIAWIKANLESVTPYWLGYSAGPTLNCVLCVFSVVEDRWFGIGNHNNSTSTKLGQKLPITTNTNLKTLSNFIDSNGYIHFMANCVASDGSTKSTIATDYVSLKITLKTDSTFTTLYCDNKRAREDKCNPVLIQKETKTVKRYIPSKECFVTESLVYNPFYSKANANANLSARGLYHSPVIGITNYGTNNPRFMEPGDGDTLSPIIPKLPLNRLYSSYMFDRSITIPHKISYDISNYGKLRPYLELPILARTSYYSYNEFYLNSNLQVSAEPLDSEYTYGVRYTKALVEKDGELYLKIQTVVPDLAGYKSAMLSSMGGNFNAQALYKLPNRPLIK